MSSDDIRLATSADRDRVIRTVAQAFHEDPAFRHFFADPALFEEEAAYFVGTLFDIRVKLGSVWVSHGGDAAALWVPPSGSPPADMSGLSSASQVRLAAYDSAIHRSLPDTSHWYLGMLASAPHRRGQGLASHLARSGIDAARTGGVPAVLETTNPSNVTLYQRNGWAVYRHLADAPIPTWIMTQ